MADTVLLKKFSTEFKIGILIFTLIPLIHLSCATTTMGKSVEEVQTSNSFLITCTVSDLSGIVVFYKNSKEKGRCEPSVIPGFPAVCVAGFTQDPITNITTYSVASANATNEDGTWSCTHSTESSNDLNVIVYEFPATNSIGNNQAYLPNNIVATTMDGTQLIVNISECVNPAPTTNWTFYQDCEGSSISPTILITSTITTDPDIACSPPYSAYKSTIRNTDMTNAVIGYDHCYRVRSFVAYPGTSFTSVPVMFSVNVTFTSPISEMSTSIATERMTSINSISELSNTTSSMISGKTTTSIKTTNIDENTQTNKTIYQSMFVTTTAIAISGSFEIPLQIMTDTFTMTGFTLSSYNEMISPSTFETSIVFPQTVSETSISLSVDTHSEKILHTTRVSAGSLIISDSSKYSILSMTISPSYIGDSNIPSLITLFSVPSLTSVATDSAFEITNASRVSIFSLTTEAVITHKTTATVDSSAVNTVLNSTKSESLLLSISENNGRIQQESESFLWSILEINSRIQHIDTNTESPLMSTTLNDHITYSSKIEELSFSSYQDFSETSVTLSEISVSSQLSSSIIDTIDNLIYTTKTLITSYLADTRHSLVSVVQPLSLDYAASSSTFLPYFIQSMYHDSSLQTTEYYATIQTEFTSHVTTSIYKSNTDNATTEIYSKRKLISAQPYMHTSVMPSQTQRASMNYIQDSTNHFQSTTDVVYSSKISEYALSTLQSTSFFNTNAIASRVHSSMKTTNKMIFETQSGMLTNSTFLSDFETTRLTKTIDFSNETIISMINPSSQQKSTDKSYIEIDTSFKDSLFSSSHCCGSLKANYLGLTTLSFKVFESMSTTPTSTVQSGLSEKNKIIIFISTSSAVFSIIVVIILIGYIRMNLSKHIEKPRNEDGDISWRNSNSPSKRVCPDYSFTGKSIYPFVNTSSSSFKMFPYEHNWNDIV